MPIYDLGDLPRQQCMSSFPTSSASEATPRVSGIHSGTFKTPESAQKQGRCGGFASGVTLQGRLPLQVPEWIPDTRRFAALAGEVENDDISYDASANLAGQRHAAP
jgi:hypothetical protein